jgi:uncharacterized protein YcbX
MPAVVNLYRYPIKGLSPELLTTLSVTSDDGIPHDREFALALGATVFDAHHPQPLDKSFFLMLRANEQLAALDVRLDCATGDVTIRQPAGPSIYANLLTEDGVERIEGFFSDYVGPACKGRPKLVHASRHKFTDASVLSPTLMRAVSLINLASVRALEEKVGVPVNPLRFRGNIYIDGLAPWQELDWVDQQIRIGEVSFRGLARTPRCAAVNVNPETAVRDANLPKAISRHFGHVDLGIYLEVLCNGDLHLGDAVA